MYYFIWLIRLIAFVIPPHLKGIRNSNSNSTSNSKSNSNSSSNSNRDSPKRISSQSGRQPVCQGYFLNIVEYL